jgi:hypothetical protein
MVTELKEGEEISTRVADYEWYAPQSSCSLHTVPQGNLVSVYICTDPRHGAERVLANVPTLYESGGCPREFVALRYYGEAYLPTKYCELADHGLETALGGYNPYLPPLTEGEYNPGNNGAWESNPLGGVGDSGEGAGGVGDTGEGATDPLPEKPAPVTPPIPAVPPAPVYPVDENGAPALQTPHSLAATPSGSACLLSWAAYNDPLTTMYIVQKITDNDPATDVRYQITNAYSFEDADVLPGHVYTYRLYAYNAEYRVISGWSQKISFTK